MTTPNIYQRINVAGRILQENPWIKDLKTSQYKSVDIDQIRRHVGAAEVEAGIVVRYVEDSFEQIEINGKAVAKVSATLVYVNIDNPSDTVEFPRTAIAWDSGDKGFNKAESMLFKNLYKGLYHIGERSEDPDSFSVEEQELLTHFKHCDESTRSKVLATVKRVSEEMQAQARKDKRRAMAEQAEGFLKKPVEIAAEPAPDYKSRRANVNIGKAKQEIAKLRDTNASPTVQGYIEMYGASVAQWDDKVVIDCFLDLEDGGEL